MASSFPPAVARRLVSVRKESEERNGAKDHDRIAARPLYQLEGEWHDEASAMNPNTTMQENSASQFHFGFGAYQSLMFPSLISLLAVYARARRMVRFDVQHELRLRFVHCEPVCPFVAFATESAIRAVGFL